MKLINKAFEENKVIIFGLRDLAQLAAYYLKNDPGYFGTSVCGFTVNSAYINEEEIAKTRQIMGKMSPTEEYPIVPYEELEQHFPPHTYKLLIPMTGTKMNSLRQSVYENAKARGYSFLSYVSSYATVLTEDIGENCFILEDNTIQPFVKIGNNVTMWSGCHIGHHSYIGHNTFFTSHVVLSGHCKVGNNSWFGVNSAIRDGLEIAESTLVAMGSVVTKNTDPEGFYMGVPAVKQPKKSTEVL